MLTQTARGTYRALVMEDDHDPPSLVQEDNEHSNQKGRPASSDQLVPRITEMCMHGLVRAVPEA